MREENCIFCRIANGDIPSRTVYEDEQFRVILQCLESRPLIKQRFYIVQLGYAFCEL